MDIDHYYEDIIKRLKKGERAKTWPQNPDELEALANKWQDSLSAMDLDNLAKILCIIEHLAQTVEDFDELIMNTLKVKDSQTIIFALGCASFHIINRQQRAGEKVPRELIEGLRSLLSNKDVEVIEWTLRTIEQLGREGLLLRDDVIKKRPTILGLFNKHKRNNLEIIEMLERRWAPYVERN